MKNKIIIILLSLLVCSLVGITLYSSVFHDKKEVNDDNKERSDSLTKNIDNDINNNKDIDTLKDDKEKREQVISKKIEKENDNNQSKSNDNTDQLEKQDDNYIHINNQDNNYVDNQEQNDYHQNNGNNINSDDNQSIQDNNSNANSDDNQSIQNDNSSVNNSNEDQSNDTDNQTVTIPINLNDDVVDTNPNDDIYTEDECSNVGIEIWMRNKDDIINFYCNTYSENGKFLGYKLDINCKSGNCSKYETEYRNK